MLSRQVAAVGIYSLAAWGAELLWLVPEALNPLLVHTSSNEGDAERDRIARVVAEVGIDLLQFHGDEPASFCAAHRRPWIRAIRMRPDTDLTALAVEYAEGRGLLLDAYRPGVPGGTGETFDWERIPIRNYVRRKDHPAALPLSHKPEGEAVQSLSVSEKFGGIHPNSLKFLLR